MSILVGIVIVADIVHGGFPLTRWSRGGKNLGDYFI